MKTNLQIKIIGENPNFTPDQLKSAVEKVLLSDDKICPTCLKSVSEHELINTFEDMKLYSNNPIKEFECLECSNDRSEKQDNPNVF